MVRRKRMKTLTKKILSVAFLMVTVVVTVTIMLSKDVEAAATKECVYATFGSGRSTTVCADVDGDKVDNITIDDSNYKMNGVNYIKASTTSPSGWSCTGGKDLYIYSYSSKNTTARGTQRCTGYSKSDGWNKILSGMEGAAKQFNSGKIEKTNNAGKTNEDTKKENDKKVVEDVAKSKNQECFHVTYNVSSSGTASAYNGDQITSVCAEVDKNGNIVTSSGIDITGSQEYIIFDTSQKSKLTVKYASGFSGTSKTYTTKSYNLGKWEDLVKQISIDASKINYSADVRGSKTTAKFKNLTDTTGYSSENTTFEENKESESSSTESSSSGSSEETCMSKASTPLGWMLCPALEDGASAIDGNDGIYSMIKGMLSIDAKLISSSDNDGTIKAWRVFLNIANIGLIVLVVIIIFSQLTGFGIDNYGIKKILPRLIVTILLIELSYVICQMAVDLSNIIGNSSSRLLDGISQYVQKNNSSAYAEYSLAAVFSGIFGGIAIAGVVAPTALSAIALGMPMGIIVCVLALIPILVAVIMFFVMLGLRQVLAIACVVLSPLAFLCYAFPNTKSIFSKWLNLFKGVLIVYPICSLLYGVGQIIKTIVIVTSSGAEAHWWMMLIAVMCPFLPFLLAPTLIKSSFAALGNLSNKLQNVGNRVKGASQEARKSFAKSDIYSDALARNTEKRLENINGKIRSGKGGKLRQGYYKYAQGRLQTQNAMLAADAQKRNRLKNEDAYKAAMAGIEENDFDQSVKDIEAQLRNGDVVFDNGAGNSIAVNSDSSAQDLGTAFRYALESNDHKGARALYNKLKNTDDGRQALIGAFDQGNLDMVKDGKASAASRIISTIAEDSSYKKSNRSFSDWATQQKGKTGTIAPTGISSKRTNTNYGATAQNLRAEDIRDMDDDEFRALTRAAQSGDQSAINVLKSVRSNSQIWDSLKEKQRSNIDGLSYNLGTYTHHANRTQATFNQKIDGTIIDPSNNKPVLDLHNYETAGSSKQYTHKTNGNTINTYVDPSGRTIDASNGVIIDLNDYN